MGTSNKLQKVDFDDMKIGNIIIKEAQCKEQLTQDHIDWSLSQWVISRVGSLVTLTDHSTSVGSAELDH